MNNNKDLRPAILVDLKKYLIRIHRDTLRLIGNPEYVLLLVNPNEKILAVLPSDRSDTKAHHISKSSLHNKKSFEIYSTPLMQSLKNISTGWEANKAYRIYGEKVPSQYVIKFPMSEALSINE